MKSRFTAVAGFLTAATLLSGSAFAFAPEFTGELPTVIITDRTTNPTVTEPFDAPNGAWGGAFRTSSAFLFRYDDAVDLAPIVSLGDAGSLADVKVLFTEYTDESDLTPNAVKTIQINGKTAVGTLPTAAADFQGAAAFDLADSFLDFRNIDFSEGSTFGPFDPVGVLTGHSFELSGPSVSRVITLHLGSDDYTDRDGASDTSFLVVTQIDDIGDRTTVPAATEIFDTLVYTNGSNFDGWLVSPISGGITGIASNGAQPTPPANPSIAGFAVTPTVTLTHNGAPAVPAGATSISARTNNSNNNAQQGLLGFTRLGSTGVLDGFAANSLYRARLNISSSSATTNADFYVQWGNVFSTGTSSTGFKNPVALGISDGTVKQLPKIGTTAFDLDTFLYTKSAPVGGEPLVFSAFIVDDSATTGQEFTLNSVEVMLASAGRSALGAGTVLKNLGGATFTADATNTAVVPVNDTNRANFSTGTVNGQDLLGGAVLAGTNAAVPNTLTIAANQLTAAHGPAPATGSYYEFTNFVFASSLGAAPFNIDNYVSGITTDPTKLYVADLWVSTTTPNNRMPNIGVYVSNDLTHFSAMNWNTGDTGIVGAPNITTPAATTKLTSQARVYSMLFQPYTPNATAESSFFFFFLWTNTNPPFQNLQSGTIVINRFILTEYDPY